ncbi:helix-turn-helix transcriptional regulator [Salininema proteolyticum]|uniref:Helix-turn-helix transcriptional regulator n=1 Tax=Salininema proteolyticum TaxID=1607685 RepID=A0ABV8U1M2_9ACTN
MELSALGLSPLQERLYRTLVDVGPHTSTLLADRLSLTEDDISPSLGRLSDLGLVLPHDGRWAASAPEPALRALLNNRRDALSRAEEAVARLAEAFRHSPSAGSIRDLVEVVSGTDAVRQRFIQVQRSAEDLLQAFVKPEHVAISAADNSAEGEALERGVEYRVVVERTMLDRPGVVTDIRETIAAGERIRAVDSLPLRMVIADRSLALVPLSAVGEPGAVVVHAGGLLDALVALFESTWDRGYDLALDPAGQGTEHDALDQGIITLLGQGLGDKQIARQLEVSPRTVQRRLRQLMDTAGASTRFQLGLWVGRQAGDHAADSST